MPFDPQLPSLLRESSGNKVAPSSHQSTGVNTPLNPLSGNAGGGAPNIANAALAARMANSGAVGRVSSPVAGTPASNNPSHASNAPAVAAMAMNGRERQMSVGSESKRRRLNASVGPLPTPGSALARQSSMGPGTPKPGTPGSRAGSAGPRPMKKTTKKVAPIQMRKKIANKKGMPKGASRRLVSGNTNSPSTTGDDDSAVDDDEGSDDENGSGAEKDGAGDEDGMDVDEDEGDDTKYCTCQRVSFGDMVGCDNEECPYQWFHWECVGLKEEPQGEWLCPTCRDLKPSQIKRAK
jgi:inhibitor of growth protein 3